MTDARRESEMVAAVRTSDVVTDRFLADSAVLADRLINALFECDQMLLFGSRQRSRC